ncbi:aminotransferase class V-fold PLP-dependent enzyme [Sphingomonas sp. SRS2]|uniref:aminotransferase class V-fold PLP-dependent enzyme n=1 Tax=Sphingomonas sp. SRS2 TaxID=133190 RepID=UPI000618485C|nr:aminotransferase class V-fold PLP-dependent enzyme [Sphingomonas sp. SRS2]KKC24790.1 penicillin epimerase [Sphingomonas sp. SRS2]
MTDRRRFLAGAAAMPGAALIGFQGLLAAPAASSALPPSYAGLDFAGMQRRLVAAYDVDTAVINFDAGYYGAMTRAVQAAYVERIGWVNRYNSTFLRGGVPGKPLAGELNKARAAVARTIGADMEEVALCGGGTDALYALIANYRDIKPGDAVLYCDIDYDEMQCAMDYLETSRGAKVVRFSLPEPHSRASILATYQKMLDETPRAKLLLLTHVSNRNGLIPPVVEIIAMAKARGVDVILDSAQAVGQMPFDVRATGANFVGFSLHKWLGAPLGTGGIYINKKRLSDILPWFGNRVYPADDIISRLPTGTADFAARLTIPMAVAQQEQIGIDRKFAHLRALRDHWVSRAADIPGVTITLPPEPDNYGAMTGFRLRGMHTPEQAKRAQAVFLEKHKLLVVAKAGLKAGPVLRVTPSLFNTTAQLDRLVDAIKTERKLFE